MSSERQEHRTSTIDYFQSAAVGTIIAFKTDMNGRARTLSGMIIEKEGEVEEATTKVVQTKNGSKFTVGPEDVVWVKTGSRWPSWVFEQFKEKTK